ncbi:MAG: hypothetical protein R2941_23170 [Desulfobacterales bacterium]
MKILFLVLLDKEIEQVKVKNQLISKYLDNNSYYALKPDIYIRTDTRNVIADTKYKIIYSDADDPKANFSE